MNIIYNILTCNFSYTLPRKQFFYYAIPIYLTLFLNPFNAIFDALFFPIILIILFVSSLLSLYRLNDAGVHKIISFILILILIMFISIYLAISLPTSSYNNEWYNDVSSEIYELAVYKRNLIITIYYIYAILYMLILFIMPSSKNKKVNIKGRKNKFFKKLKYLYIAYLLNPLYKCFKFKKNYKMSSKASFYFWILIIISIILYVIIIFYYSLSLIILRDIISNFTGGVFEDKNLGLGVLFSLSFIVNGLIFLFILIRIVSSYATYRIYDVLGFKKSYINTIFIIYSAAAALIFVSLMIYAVEIKNGSNLHYYFIIFHAILLLILTLLPSKKIKNYKNNKIKYEEIK